MRRRKPSELADHIRHIRRQGRDKMHSLLRDRMDEAEHLCMQHDPGNDHVADRSHLLSPIRRISQDRTPNRGQMHAQLMGPAGLRKELHVGRQFCKPFRHAVLRGRRLGPGRARGEFFPVLGIPPDSDVDHSLALLRDTPDQGFVDPVYGMPLELVDQSRMSPILFGDDHDARGVLVQPVYHPRPFLAADGGERPGPGFEMMQQGIDQGARPIPGSRMDHQAGLFIQNQQCVIFIEDFKGNGLGLNVQRFRPGDPEHDDVAGFDFVTGLGDLPVRR